MRHPKSKQDKASVCASLLVGMIPEVTHLLPMPLSLAADAIVVVVAIIVLFQ